MNTVGNGGSNQTDLLGGCSNNPHGRWWWLGSVIYIVLVKPTGLADGLDVECERKLSRMTIRYLAWAPGSRGLSITENGKAMGRAGLMFFCQVESVGIPGSVLLGMSIRHQNGDVQEAQVDVQGRNHGWGPGCQCKFGIISKYMISKTMKLEAITAIVIINIFRLVQAHFISHLDFINFLTDLPFHYPPSALLLEWFKKKKTRVNGIESLLCLIPSRGFLSHWIC